MDWDKYLPFILTWGVSVVTGVFALLGGWLVHRSNLKQLTVKLAHENDKERREVQRARLEELYSLIDRWADKVVMYYATYHKVMKGDLTYNQALDFTIGAPPVDFNRMFTIAELYFPSAHDVLQELKELRDNAASIESSFKEAYKQGQATSEKHANLLTSVLERCNTAVNKYQRALAAHAKDV